jgi:hypothetical protein
MCSRQWVRSATHGCACGRGRVGDAWLQDLCLSCLPGAAAGIMLETESGPGASSAVTVMYVLVLESSNDADDYSVEVVRAVVKRN